MARGSQSRQAADVLPGAAVWKGGTGAGVDYLPQLGLADGLPDAGALRTAVFGSDGDK